MSKRHGVFYHLRVSHHRPLLLQGGRDGPVPTGPPGPFERMFTPCPACGFAGVERFVSPELIAIVISLQLNLLPLMRGGQPLFSLDRVRTPWGCKPARILLAFSFDFDITWRLQSTGFPKCHDILRELLFMCQWHSLSFSRVFDGFFYPPAVPLVGHANGRPLI